MTRRRVRVEVDEHATRLTLTLPFSSLLDVQEALAYVRDLEEHPEKLVFLALDIEEGNLELDGIG